LGKNGERGTQLFRLQTSELATNPLSRPNSEPSWTKGNKNNNNWEIKERKKKDFQSRKEKKWRSFHWSTYPLDLGVSINRNDVQPQDQSH
jgi:hypothetical protein